jgi:hypothetical protein
MSSFMTFGSWQISLAKRSRSSFAPVVFLVYVQEDLPPPSSDADEGNQWEVQTDAGWIPF